MMIPSFVHSGLAASACILAFVTSTTAAQAPGTFEVVGETLVSAMMMFLGNDEKVYIVDKAQGNPTQIDNHPAWATVWDIKSRSATPVAVYTNPFCAAGASLGDGRWAVFGGNAPLGPNGTTPKVKGQTVQDPDYKDYDGRRVVRIVEPCTGDTSQFGADCVWIDDVRLNAMQQERWYPAVESLPNGDVVLIGGMKSGGYVNRNWPDEDPGRSNGGSIPTFEFFPARGNATDMQLLIDTSGLNTYVHTYLMRSGRMFVQSYLKTILWNYEENKETALPDMPDGIVRVYPASAGVAMLPLTPRNSYNPSILFCGGSNLNDEQWGNFTSPAVNTWEYLASKDCRRITPEPLDDTVAPQYEKDDDMLEGRTMGQFIILPNGKLLMLNGATNGTAGYSTTGTPDTPPDQMPFGASLASGPVLQPALYDPEAPAGSRWSREGLASSNIPRMYHSSALLLPDGSVFIAGSNPEGEYRPDAIFPTEYRAEVFYPPYWQDVRPAVSGIPERLSYGGDGFDLTVDAASYSGDSNTAAENATVVIIRPGFSTHAMNMGQRYLELQSTYSVSDDGTITMHVAQLPPNANLVTPGPVLIFVNINGVPSIGKMLQVGSGAIEVQTMHDATVLPSSVRATNGAVGKAASANADTATGATGNSKSSGPPLAVLIGCIAGGAALLLALIALLVFCVRRRRRNNQLSPKGISSKNIAINRARPGTTLGFKDYQPGEQPPMSSASAFPILGRSTSNGSNRSGLLAANTFAYPGRDGASSPDSMYSASMRLSLDPLRR